MNENQNEKNILNIISYLPITMMFVILFLGVLFLFSENKKTFDLQKKELEENYIKDNKLEINEQINRVYNLIKNKQATSEIKLKKELKERVYEAHTIATKLYETFKNEKSHKEILEIIKATLGEITFNQGRGYIFMDDVNGVKILQPFDKSKEGKKYTEFVGPSEYKPFLNMIETIKQKTERFDRYDWYKPEAPTEVSTKIAFYKYFAPFNMIIGTGEYIEDFNNELKKEVLDIISSTKYRQYGYIFVVDYDGTYLSHADKNLLNTNIDENNYMTPKRTIEDLIEIGKNDGGFLTYMQHKKANTNKSSNKTSYVRAMNEWKWVIGTGFYEDDIQFLVEKKRLKSTKDLKNTFIK